MGNESQPDSMALNTVKADEEANVGSVKEEKSAIDRDAPGPNPTSQQTETERKQRRNPLLIFFSAIASIFAGMINLSATAGQGMSKFYWHIPVLYGDKTAREWPEITGFRSGCTAGGKSLFYGFYDGITGVVMLPYKGAKGAGLKGLGIGILHGIGGLFFKPLSGIWAFIGHPIFGLHKHISNRKNSQQQSQSSPV
ncbi:hypothetical protein F4777DRAFT_582352 [Nemania sp. FL0916]|nr:hypothetical protein F4777DRAFT_582352 [Nemania sp. FL0916]